MRFVVFGAGAIGGVVGARLHQAGFPVSVIARGAHLEAIRRDGLTLLTPEERSVLPLTAAASPAELEWSGDELVLLATKGQDTLGALSALRAAAGPGVPVACLQNGVENERTAQRLMETVYAAAVMCPTAHLEPGTVLAYGTDLTGLIDVGRYPDGVDERCRELCAALERARFISRPTPDAMRLKYAKLLLNLGNAAEALCGPGEPTEALTERARAEGRAVLTAAGIDFQADAVADLNGRWAHLGVREIEGRPRSGSSSWQSLARGTGTIETDYLNGEIALEGRRRGIPTPVNHALCRLAWRAARDGLAPGGLSVDAVLAEAGEPRPPAGVGETDERIPA